MNMYARYKTDPVAEQEGTEVAFTEDLFIRVRSVRSRKVRAVQAQISKRNQRFHRAGSPIPPDVQDADNIDLAVAIIAGWRGAGATGPDGQPLEYSAANARQVMTDLAELRDQVIGAAVLAETFRDEESQAATENLSSASAVSSSSAAPGAQAS